MCKYFCFLIITYIFNYLLLIFKGSNVHTKWSTDHRSSPKQRPTTAGHRALLAFYVFFLFVPIYIINPFFKVPFVTYLCRMVRNPLCTSRLVLGLMSTNVVDNIQSGWLVYQSHRFDWMTES